MAFQIKNFVSVVASMINKFRSAQSGVTDFNIGSVARTLIEAPAVEIDEAYQQMFVGLREAIPVATYNSFNFDRLPARPATGVIRVTIAGLTGDTQISAGTLFTGKTTKAAYRASGDVTILAGITVVDVLVAAVVPGLAGNILAGEEFTVGPAPESFVSATNLVAFFDGAEVESDDQRKERFTAFISTLPRATNAAIDYGARQAVIYDASGAEVERVRTVQVIEPYLEDDEEPISLVNVYIHNGSGETSDALVAEVSKVLHGYVNASGDKVPGWKAAGVKVVVAKASETDLDLTAVLTARPGYTAAALAEQAETVLAEYVRSIEIGQPFLLSQAIYLVKSIEGVENIVFSDPTGDQASGASEKLVAGTVTVTTS